MQAAAPARPACAVAARAAASKRVELTPRARELYEELSHESSRVLSLPNIVDGYYIAPKFLDKARSAFPTFCSC
jgi:hypothetical protein